jgi:hypothetical protein
MTGRTAYFGLLKVGKPKAGETVVVSAAAVRVSCAVVRAGSSSTLAIPGSCPTLSPGTAWLTGWGYET